MRDRPAARAHGAARSGGTAKNVPSCVSSTIASSSMRLAQRLIASFFCSPHHEGSPPGERPSS